MQALQSFCSSVFSAILSSCPFNSGNNAQIPEQTKNTPPIPPSPIAFQPQEREFIAGFRGDESTPPARNYRILFINGIRYEHDRAADAAYAVSKVFHNMRVDYAYLKLNAGIVRDVLKGNKSPHYRTHIIPLATHIRKLILEGENSLRKDDDEDSLSTASDPVQRATSSDSQISSFSKRRIYALKDSLDTTSSKVVIVVHSGGAALLKAALSLLSPQTRKKIDVITLGGAYQFGSSDVGKAYNIIHMNDWVPTFSWLCSKDVAPDAAIEYVGSRLSIPMSGHAFFSPEYQGALKRIMTAYFRQIAEIALIYRSPSLDSVIDDEEEESPIELSCITDTIFIEDDNQHIANSCKFEEIYDDESDDSIIDITQCGSSSDESDRLSTDSDEVDTHYTVKLQNKSATLTHQSWDSLQPMLNSTKGQQYVLQSGRRNSLPLLPGAEEIKV